MPILCMDVYNKLLPLGEKDAQLITNLSAGIDLTLGENPVLDQLCGPWRYAAYAVLFAVARQSCIEGMENADSPDQRRKCNDALVLMDKVRELVDTPTPNKPKQITASSDDDYSTLNDFLEAVGAIPKVPKKEFLN